jgi:hypothetical protein
MRKIIGWIQSNKVTTILVFAILFLLASNYGSPLTYKSSPARDRLATDVFTGSEEMSTSSFAPIPKTGGGAPRLDITDRKVVTESTLSLVVTDVRNAIKDIAIYAKGLGGYMVDSSQTAPEGLATGNISIRVPSDKLDVALEYLRNASVKVVSERIKGTDITDEYIDVEARLNTLYGTKSRYETILDRSVEIEDIMNVTQQILYVQDQIDSLKGRLEYMDATSSSSLITVYLSTDEFELPYSPEQPWRPSVIFKYAVRSLVQTSRNVGSFLIWVGVYAVIWIPVLVIAYVIKKKKKSPIRNQ